ncbi:Hsp20/alpha crystallin family protein [Bosea psychrotolerans]|uniref:HSP20 family protein n=1 Tax=Bosea psychrotolerans TaxID=1871628 RepID=A0A2S4LXG2_9HYPH|nr:Hsp20/alpha crystallin family protein [Bosea psychrotolerans]POR47144.1 HSP20 family protein [Bosea psychrotolerans]
MAEAATKLPVRSEQHPAAETSSTGAWAPVDRLLHEVERLFERFGAGAVQLPFSRTSLFHGAWPRDVSWGLNPAIDVTERDKNYKVTAELPGIDPSDIEVKLSNGVLTIKGEKKDENERREADYHLSERHYGAFLRSFQLPDGVDADKVEALFEKGVLTIKLPKTADSQKSNRKIAIKAA